MREPDLTVRLSFLPIKKQTAMNNESKFIKRARFFLQDLQEEKFPNASSLADACKCSRNTAQRTIYRLRDEYLVPIEYDSSQKGYYMTDKNFTLPPDLPPGRDELTALLLARSLVARFDLYDVKKNLDSLWNAYASANTSVRRDLAPLASFFSADCTTISQIGEAGTLAFLDAAASGQSVSFYYESPWSKNGKVRRGYIRRVHFSDGVLYLLFQSESGRQLILNASFVEDFKILDYTIEIADKACHEITSFAGFGVWSGQVPEIVEIHILPPASSYYASQRWHDEQLDEWNNEVLVRRFTAVKGPEVVRRVLSLGKYVSHIEPPELKELVLQEITAMNRNFKKK